MLLPLQLPIVIRKKRKGKPEENVASAPCVTKSTLTLRRGVGIGNIGHRTDFLSVINLRIWILDRGQTHWKD